LKRLYQLGAHRNYANTGLSSQSQCPSLDVNVTPPQAGNLSNACPGSKDQQYRHPWPTIQQLDNLDDILRHRCVIVPYRWCLDFQ